MLMEKAAAAAVRDENDDDDDHGQHLIVAHSTLTINRVVSDADAIFLSLAIFSQS